MIGLTKEAESTIKAALESPACDLRTIQIAVDLYINLGRFDQVEPTLDKLETLALKPTPELLAWAQRTRSLARLSTGRLAEMDRALSLVDENLERDPASTPDLRLKAVIVALRAGSRGAGIEMLEKLDRSGQLSASEQFILARAYLAAGQADKYQSQMLKILGAPVKSPQHLVHFVQLLDCPAGN